MEVPVYFFSGVRDYNTPLALIREYYETIEAPHKELVVFEGSAHMPFFAQPERFVSEAISRGRQTMSAGGPSQPVPEPKGEQKTRRRR